MQSRKQQAEAATPRQSPKQRDSLFTNLQPGVSSVLNLTTFFKSLLDRVKAGQDTDGILADFMQFLDDYFKRKNFSEEERRKHLNNSLEMKRIIEEIYDALRDYIFTEFRENFFVNNLNLFIAKHEDCLIDKCDEAFIQQINTIKNYLDQLINKLEEEIKCSPIKKPTPENSVKIPREKQTDGQALQIDKRTAVANLYSACEPRVKKAVEEKIRALAKKDSQSVHAELTAQENKLSFKQKWQKLPRKYKILAGISIGIGSLILGAGLLALFGGLALFCPPSLIAIIPFTAKIACIAGGGAASVGIASAHAYHISRQEQEMDPISSLPPPPAPVRPSSPSSTHGSVTRQLHFDSPSQSSVDRSPSNKLGDDNFKPALMSSASPPPSLLSITSLTQQDAAELSIGSRPSTPILPILCEQLSMPRL